MKKITIAVDGFSSCGKSTMAKDLAGALGYIYIDTGAMYRAVTLYAMRGGMINADGTARLSDLRRSLDNIHISFRQNNDKPYHADTLLNGEDVEHEIRGIDVSSHVSVIAAIPFVREKLVREQRSMGADGGVVMDGRDIGTVVFPKAEMKVFVTAAAEVRAERRYKELLAKRKEGDKEVSYDDILKNVEERDYIDTHRSVAPLHPAPDALILDNSGMTIDEQNAWLLRHLPSAISECL